MVCESGTGNGVEVCRLEMEASGICLGPLNFFQNSASCHVKILAGTIQFSWSSDRTNIGPLDPLIDALMEGGVVWNCWFFPAVTHAIGPTTELSSLPLNYLSGFQLHVPLSHVPSTVVPCLPVPCPTETSAASSFLNSRASTSFVTSI